MEGLIKKKIREKKHSVCRVNIYPPNPPHCWEMEYLTRTREDESQDGHITPPPPRGLGMTHWSRCLVPMQSPPS